MVGGLYLEILSNGVKRWRMKYRYGGKARLLTFGAYPAVGLREARERRDRARKLLAGGADPIVEKRAEKARMEAERKSHAATFSDAAWEWFNAWRCNKAPSNVEKIRGQMIKDVLPGLGRSRLPESPRRMFFKPATASRSAAQGIPRIGCWATWMPSSNT